MSIEAVVAYWQQSGAPTDDQAEAVVARARSAGFSFDGTDLRTARAVRALLAGVLHDDALRAELAAAGEPMDALLEAARRSGYDLRRDDVGAVLRALTAGQGELDGDQLDRVAGGTLVFRPEVDDEVLVAFVRGDLGAPVILGSLWSGQDQPPS